MAERERFINAGGWFDRDQNKHISYDEYRRLTGQQPLSARKYTSANPREGTREDWGQATWSGAFNDGRDVIYDDWGNMIGYQAPDGIRTNQGGKISIGQDYSQNRLKGDVRDQLARTPNLTTAGGAPVKGLPFSDESNISITDWMQRTRGPGWGPNSLPNLWGNRLVDPTPIPPGQQGAGRPAGAGGAGYNFTPGGQPAFGGSQAPTRSWQNINPFTSPSSNTQTPGGGPSSPGGGGASRSALAQALAKSPWRF